MSFRSTEGSQHRDAGAAAQKQVAKLILNADNDYEIAVTNAAADAILISNADGDYEIATSGTEAARFVVVAGNIYLLPL